MFLALVNVEQLFIKCCKIGLSVGCLMFADSSEETVHCVGSFHLVVFFLLDLISFNDSSSTLFEFSSNVGHSSLGRHRNGGPSIQVFTSSGGAPLVKTSAGLTSDLMYLNASVSRVS